MLPLASTAMLWGKLNSPGLLPRSPHCLTPTAVLVVFGYSRVDVAVTDEDVPFRVPGDVGRLAELAVNRGARRGDACLRRGLVGCFLFAAQKPCSRDPPG